MSVHVVDAKIDVYRPSNESINTLDADLTIPSSDIRGVSVSRRMQNQIDRGQIRLDNASGTYTGSLTHGDRLEFRIIRETDSTWVRRWTAMVRNLSHERSDPSDATLAIEADDWVFSILDSRTILGHFYEDPISGRSYAVLDRALSEHAPEIDRSSLPALDKLVSITWGAGTKLIDAVNDLAEIADAATWSVGKTLYFQPIDGINSSFDLVERDRTEPDVRFRDDKLATRVRLLGGTALAVDSEQLIHTGYTTVTRDQRLLYQLGTRKSRVARIEVWTRRSGSGEDFVVRLQTDNEGEPYNPDDSNSDVAAHRLSPEFVDDDGYTTFILPKHRLAEAQPWLIIESGGESGQDIGIDASTGFPAHIAYYPYPVDTIAEDADAAAEYGVRETAISDTSIETHSQARDRIQAILRHTARPDKEFTFTPESTRAHGLDIGDVITLDETALGATGDYIVTIVTDAYSGIRMDTAVTAQEVASI